MNKKEDITWDLAKLVFSIILDTVDFILSFTFFKIPFIGQFSAIIFELVIMVFAVMLWGALGLTQLWEVIDVTDTVDAFIPTVTIVGLISIFNKRRKK